MSRFTHAVWVQIQYIIVIYVTRVDGCFWRRRKIELREKTPLSTTVHYYSETIKRGRTLKAGIVCAAVTADLRR